MLQRRTSQADNDGVEVNRLMKGEESDQCQKLTPTDRFGLISYGDCSFSAKSIYQSVYCEGQFSVVGEFNHQVYGDVRASNYPETPKYVTIDPNGLIMKPFPGRSDDMKKHFTFFKTFFNSHGKSDFDSDGNWKGAKRYMDTMKENGWHQHGPSSLWKTCGEGAHKCMVHIVYTGKFDWKGGYDQVLADVGLKHQINGELLRWCDDESTKDGKTQCVKNGHRDVYQDSIEGFRTMVIFVPEDLHEEHRTVQLTNADGRKWGPTVFAPRSKVVLLSDFADGQIIAGEFGAVQRKSDQQMHGYFFDQDAMCIPDVS